MKARVKETGEIIDVFEKVNSSGYKYYVSNNGFKPYDSAELDFENFKEIDWEQRRYETAVKIFSGLSSTTTIRQEGEIDKLVELSLHYTDRLIEKLKSN